MIDSRPADAAMNRPVPRAGLAAAARRELDRARHQFRRVLGHATRVELCLFDAAGRRETARLALPSRTGDIWHGFLPARFGGPGTLYGYRVHGPYQPARRATASIRRSCWSIPARTALARRPHLAPVAARRRARATTGIADDDDSAPYVPRCRVVDPAASTGASVRSPNVPWRDTIIYELHVKGFTQRHPGVPRAPARQVPRARAARGASTTCKRLGVTTVELMPVQAFVSEKFLVERGPRRTTGATTRSRGSRPTPRYAVDDPVVEFKTMVRALHDAGLEVMLDVVFNHTAEGNEHGPTLSLRGFDNSMYYRLFPHNRAHYKNFSGCGNTVNFDDPAVRALVHRLPALLDRRRCASTASASTSRRSSVATRSGFSRDAPFFAALRSDPVLAYVKLIAEPWDVGPGGYQLGHFPAGWSEWNDRYRDTVRAFWRGDRPLVGDVRRALRRLERPVPRSTAASRPRASTSSPRTTASRCTTSCPTTSATTRPTSRTAPTATRTT